MTERDIFLANFRKAQQDGLVDVKFYVDRTPGMTPDDFYAAVNRMDSAISAGKVTVHDRWEEQVQRHDISSLLA